MSVFVKAIGSPSFNCLFISSRTPPTSISQVLSLPPSQLSFSLCVSRWPVLYIHPSSYIETPLKFSGGLLDKGNALNLCLYGGCGNFYYHNMSVRCVSFKTYIRYYNVHILDFDPCTSRMEGQNHKNIIDTHCFANIRITS